MLDSEFTVLHQLMLAEQEWFDLQMYTQDCKFFFFFWFKELAGVFFNHKQSEHGEARINLIYDS